MFFLLFPVSVGKCCKWCNQLTSIYTTNHQNIWTDPLPMSIQIIKNTISTTLRVWSNLCTLILISVGDNHLSGKLQPFFNTCMPLTQRNLHTPISIRSEYLVPATDFDYDTSTCLELGLQLPHQIGQPGIKLIIHTPPKTPALAFGPKSTQPPLLSCCATMNNLVIIIVCTWCNHQIFSGLSRPISNQTCCALKKIP